MSNSDLFYERRNNGRSSSYWWKYFDTILSFKFPKSFLVELFNTSDSTIDRWTELSTNKKEIEKMCCRPGIRNHHFDKMKRLWTLLMRSDKLVSYYYTYNKLTNEECAVVVELQNILTIYENTAYESISPVFRIQLMEIIKKIIFGGLFRLGGRGLHKYKIIYEPRFNGIGGLYHGSYTVEKK